MTDTLKGTFIIKNVPRLKKSLYPDPEYFDPKLYPSFSMRNCRLKLSLLRTDFTYGEDEFIINVGNTNPKAINIFLPLIESINGSKDDYVNYINSSTLIQGAVFEIEYRNDEKHPGVIHPINLVYKELKNFKTVVKSSAKPLF